MFQRLDLEFLECLKVLGGVINWFDYGGDWWTATAAVVGGKITCI